MSIANSRYGIDRMYRPIILPAAGNALAVSDNGGTEVISFGAGTWWAHADSSESHQGLFYELISQMNGSATLAGTYTISAHTPSGSSLTNSGIRIERTDGGGTFTVAFSSGSTTLDPQLLGFDSNEGDRVGVTVGGNPYLDSDYSVLGQWQSPHGATNKRDTRKQSPNSSSPDPVNRYVNPWQGHRLRPMEYRAVPAGHVRRFAAEDATIAGDAGLPTGDSNNALADFLWEASASNEDILVVYDEGDQDLQVDSHTDLYEYVRFASDEEIAGLMGVIEDFPNGEKYDLTWHFASALSDPEYKDP